MRKIFLSILLFILFVLISSHVSHAARYATCDACGLCPELKENSSICEVVDTQIPGDWKNCVKCLYPLLYPQSSDPYPNIPPDVCNTLIIEETGLRTGLLRNPATVGRQYTMLGCLTSGSNVGFDTSEGAGAPSVVQALLNVIFSLAGGLALLYLMYGAFIILTSQADPERLNYGRRLIYGSMVGLIITVASVFIVNIIGSGILRIPGFSGGVTP